jgi:hypothetical protein
MKAEHKRGPSQYAHSTTFSPFIARWGAVRIMASSPQIFGIPLADFLGAAGTALLQIKNARGLTLADMAFVMRRSDDQVARYIAGESEMGFVTWGLALTEWPELEERLKESAARIATSAGQRSMIRHLRQWLAVRRLNRLVAKQRNSFEVVDYRRRREAALKHQPKVWA